jgi:hypothetical protein
MEDNTSLLLLRHAVTTSLTRPPEPPSIQELWYARIQEVIDWGREALREDKPQSYRTIFARRFLEATDPNYRPVELGGNGEPPL